MSIFKRLSKIIEANLNNLLDKIEEHQNKDHLKDESSFDKFEEISKQIEAQEELNKLDNQENAENLQKELKKLKDKTKL